MLASLKARGFRNLNSLECCFEDRVQLLLGDNGAGKTSVLEAIYLLSTTRSFRSAQIADCCQHGETGFFLQGEVDRDQRTSLEFSWQKAKRKRAVNGQSVPIANHLAVLPVICWTAASLEVLVGPPSERRRFLDRGVIGLRPAMVDTFSRYRQILQEKRKWLARQEGSRVSGTRSEEFHSWNSLLAQTAAKIIQLRSQYTEKLQQSLTEILQKCGLGFPPITLQYRPSPKIEGDGSEEEIYQELERVMDRELKLERPLIGPHRDELRILWDRHGIRRVASAGERKALGLSLLAAQGEILKKSGRKPVYLLDDADTELDSVRLASLWTVFGNGGQLFATSNRPQIWQELEVHQRWSLDQGVLQAV